MIVRYILLFLGVLACSTSAIFIRESATDPFVLTAFRLVIASVLLSPVLLTQLRRHGAAFTMNHLRRTRAPAAVLAFHLILWTLGARMTAVAQATLIVNLVPVALPFFLVWIAGERINRAEVIGTALAITGLGILSLKDVFRGGGSVSGDAVCFLSMLLFALYLALGRRNRDFPSIWLYVIPVYGQAAVICTLVALFRVSTFDYHSGREWALMLAMGAIPTVCGHSLLNSAMRRIRGQIVSLCNVSQFVFAGTMAFILFGELPRALFYLASTIVVAGVAVVVLAAPRPAGDLVSGNAPPRP